MKSKSRIVTIVTVSEFALEVICANNITLHDLLIPRFNELLENIWDIFPRLYHEENYDIYWRCEELTFAKVYDYFSYFTALNLMAENAFYIVLRDSKAWIYETLDSTSNVHPTYATFKDSLNEGNFDSWDYEDFFDNSKHNDDEEILMEAMEEFKPPKFYTMDQAQRFMIIEHSKLGYPKKRDKLVLPDDSVIHMRPKPVKGKDKKKDKKGKGDKKGKKK